MKIKIRGNNNADETTDITFIIKSTKQCYRATMARLNMFTKNPSEPPEQMAMAKRLFGNHGYYYDVFKKWLPKGKPEKKHVIGIDLSPAVGPCAYSVKELAKKLGVSEDTIRRDIQKGKYPTAKKENGKWVIYFPLGKVEANV